MSQLTSFTSKIKQSSLIVFVLMFLLIVETISAETRYRVRSSDNVNSIVERHYPNSDLTKGQLLVGVLMTNPGAFKGGNVNFLLRGKRLILPNQSEFEKISPEKASEVLSEHARFFRFGITGDLPTPTYAQMSAEPETADINIASSEILQKQESQNLKIDKLLQESNDLKKQLEALLNEKTDRDNRLLELEKSLKQSLNAKNSATVSEGLSGSVRQSESKNAQQEEIQTSDKPLVNSNETTDATPSAEVEIETINAQVSKVENESTIEANDKNNVVNAPKIDSALMTTSSNNTSKITSTNNEEQGLNNRPEPSESSLSKLIWLLPLLLLALFLYFVFGKKRKINEENETVEVNESGYIEPYETNIEAIQQSVENTNNEPVESTLETSVKLDVARAYIEAEETQSAIDILTEIIEEGSDMQKQQAHDLLDTIS